MIAIPSTESDSVEVRKTTTQPNHSEPKASRSILVPATMLAILTILNLTILNTVPSLAQLPNTPVASSDSETVDTGANSVHRIDQIRPDAPELAAYGPFAVGVRTLTVTHRNQIDLLAVERAVAEGHSFDDGTSELPRSDRSLPLEIWYPAAPGGRAVPAEVYLRDGVTTFQVLGKAMRAAEPIGRRSAGGASEGVAEVDGEAPPTSAAPFPLVIISHGYPGNRFLLSHLAENLASKGFVVASIDHTDSTYRTRAAFSSTLVNRPLDQVFVLNELARLATEESSFLHQLVDTNRTGLIGYSMGGYGAVISAGGGVTQKAVDEAVPARLLAIHQAGSETRQRHFDGRLKAVVAFAPWGMKAGFWDSAGMAKVAVPMLYVAGNKDLVSGYEDGVRALFEQSTNVVRYLLTFENAGHNAAAPMPAPTASMSARGELPATFGHYADPVWDTVRMNNIGQHFVTAFFDFYLKGDSTKRSYLDLLPVAESGVWSVNEAGEFTDEHTYWKGFPRRTALGLRFEKLSP